MCSRLDRFLACDGLFEYWKIEGKVVGSKNIFSDFPIWLQGNPHNWGLKPFKLFECCFNHDGFFPFMEETWSSFIIWGKVGFDLKEKLKLLKNKLRIWNNGVFGMIDLEVDKTVNMLNFLISLS